MRRFKCEWRSYRWARTSAARRMCAQPPTEGSMYCAEHLALALAKVEALPLWKRRKWKALK